VFPDAGAWPGLADARAVSAMFHAYECTVAGSLLACEREPEGGTVVSAGERDSLAVVPAQSVALTVDVVSAQDTFVVALELVTVGANDQRAGAALRFRPGDCFVKGPTANAVDPDQPDQTRAR
jgi:hypothetical protein